jgi:GntR family transcriptional regulator
VSDDSTRDGFVAPARETGLRRAARQSIADSCAEVLRSAILDGIFQPGQQLPTEKDLSDQLGASRGTVREALNSIERLGLIVRRQGVGTFVAAEPVTEDLNTNAGITQMLSVAGHPSKIGKVSVRTGEATPEETAELDVELGAPVVRVFRIHLVDSRPVVRCTDVTPVDLTDIKEVQRRLAAGGSIYEFLRDQGAAVVRGVASLKPVKALDDVARDLRVDIGEPLMLLLQTDFDRGSRPVMYSVEYHLPGFFVFRVQRIGPHA